MNKKLIILLALIAVAVFALTWQHIPYVNTYIWNSGIVETYADARTQVSDAIKTNPFSLVGVAGVLCTSLIGSIKKWWDTVKAGRTQVNELRLGFQQEKGMLLAGFNDVKDSLTGNISQLKEEYVGLESKYTELEAVVTMKNAAIIDVQSELGKVQQQLISEQTKLLDVTKEMDEYRIILEQKALPTTH